MPKRLAGATLVALTLLVPAPRGQAYAADAPSFDPATPVPAAPPSTGDGATLRAVTSRGRLRCGTSAGLSGFGQVDASGRWSGFDVDFCRAVAAAIFNDPTRVDFVSLTAGDRLIALRDGRIDILSRTTTWTLSREADRNLLFAGVTYYDGQGFLVRRSLGVGDAGALPSNAICVQQDTTTELNLSDFFRQRGLAYTPKIFASGADVEAAYRDGKCGAYTADASGLFALRASLAKPDDHLILPQIISKEPLGPAVRQGDDGWFLIVRWTLNAMVDADEMNVTKANAEAMTKSEDPKIKRLLGLEGDFGRLLGLTNDWAFRIVKLVGNYNDVFQRNLGDGSTLKIKRGLNDLWTRGGLHYAPPLQ